MTWKEANRRIVLKGIGAGVAGSAALSAAVTGGDTGDNRRQQSFVWANDNVWEMLESEPLIEQDGELVNPDAEGDSSAHRPLYAVAPQDGEHSPHAAPPGPPFPLDHVIALDPGTKKFFSAQWHTHAVIPTENSFQSPLAGSGCNGAGHTRNHHKRNHVVTERNSCLGGGGSQAW